MEGMPLMSEERIKLSVEVSPELYETIDRLAKKGHESKSDVLRKGIAFMQVALEAKQAGKKIGIAALGQSLETEIIGI
jgi:predicted transcriptional regulator